MLLPAARPYTHLTTHALGSHLWAPALGAHTGPSSTRTLSPKPCPYTAPTLPPNRIQQDLNTAPWPHEVLACSESPAVAEQWLVPGPAHAATVAMLSVQASACTRARVRVAGRVHVRVCVCEHVSVHRASSQMQS